MVEVPIRKITKVQENFRPLLDGPGPLLKNLVLSPSWHKSALLQGGGMGTVKHSQCQYDVSKQGGVSWRQYTYEVVMWLHLWKNEDMDILKRTLLAVWVPQVII